MMKKSIESDNTVEYQFTQYGTWGRFVTPAGAVEFLETKARIGAAAKDREKRLTQQLLPVREVLPSQVMDFNQLLQRDLDDHRVATGLVPYILEQSSVGPGFFPPILAALLPFDGTDPVPSFPNRQEVERWDDKIGWWKGYRFGEAFQFERMQAQSDPIDHDIKLGRLSWNPEDARLVVIDGQHRAMALLAVDRTLNNSWSQSGEKYKYFYEPYIQRFLSSKTPDEKKQLFANLEFPVTIVWFPEANGTQRDHHTAARKLFVDVNQNARAPSESRLLLLSDGDLLSIFTREVLNQFRKGTAKLPICAVEYDHPGRDQASSSKWSAISNVITLRDCLSRAIFGPAKFYTDLSLLFGSKESESARADFMRKTLEIASEIGETVEDLKRDEITNAEFPVSYVEFFNKQLMKGWGNFLARVLGEVTPYAAHGEAIVVMRDNWATAGSTDSLAKDALFEGVGMFWTIRDSQRHWANANQLRQDIGEKPFEKTDVVKTWETISQKQLEFYKLRSKLYLGREDDTTVEMSNEAFDVFATNACQLGLVLAARTLTFRGGIGLAGMNEFTSAFIGAVNAALSGGPKAGFGRKLFVSRSHEHALNRIPRLDTPYAVYFRYFWFELLCTDEAAPLIDPVISRKLLEAARDETRSVYVSYLEREWKKALKRTNPSKTDKELQAEAENEVADTLQKSLSKWFGIKKAEFDAWRKKASQTTKLQAPASVEEGNSDVEDTTSDTSSNEIEPSTFEELLEKKIDPD
ncbi:DNA sulfur modification protein DndB [Burkholderia ubonensis]|uniref:DNA sulfur modification protein DndB n=2 Tax=Burkholderia ubonensis TaxID=101571 RepID=UPI0009B4A5E7|nr:DNA sulfur modification protein DndB [Burkholderia ubonensis]